eukprot:12113159-Ditylum_brightwellii.AAC.1
MPVPPLFHQDPEELMLPCQEGEPGVKVVARLVLLPSPRDAPFLCQVNRERETPANGYQSPFDVGP